MMSFRNVFVFLTLAGLLGCSEATVDPLDGAAGKTDQMVPISWTYLMHAEDTGSVVLCTIPMPDGTIVEMPTPADWKGEGKMSHLGILDEELGTATFTSCNFGLYDGGPALIGELSTTVVGANGDALEMEGVLYLTLAIGESGPVPGPAYGAYDIVGGSGRFDGASGWMNTVEQVSEGGALGQGEGMVTPPGRLR